MTDYLNWTTAKDRSVADVQRDAVWAEINLLADGAPVAGSAAAKVNANQAVTVSVLANASDPTTTS